eukprot:scaffold1124_cov361-Prasinococcus_capsulatus_cf.AAC.7
MFGRREGALKDDGRFGLVLLRACSGRAPPLRRAACAKPVSVSAQVPRRSLPLAPRRAGRTFSVTTSADVAGIRWLVSRDCGATKIFLSDGGVEVKEQEFGSSRLNPVGLTGRTIDLLLSQAQQDRLRAVQNNHLMSLVGCVPRKSARAGAGRA